MTKLPDHLFLASSDGCLYDTRATDWSSKRPLRLNYNWPHREINSVTDLKATLRSGPYAWPGGYPLYFITSDGAALSFEAVQAELRGILDSMAHNANDGWRIVGCEINWEDNQLFCEHSNRRIPSAYAD